MLCVCFIHFSRKEYIHKNVNYLIQLIEDVDEILFYIIFRGHIEIKL